MRFGPEGIGPHHIYSGWARTTRATTEPADFDIVTGACLLTPRDLFLDLHGFDEFFWNGYEDVDYCLRVRQLGLRVVYEPSAILYHFESQSGVQRKRRVLHNIKTLGQRWGTLINPDHNRFWSREGFIRRESLAGVVPTMVSWPLPKITIVVHGDMPEDAASLLDALRDNRLQPERIVWLADGGIPPGCESSGASDAVAAVRELFSDRSDRYIAFVETGTRLTSGWLDDLLNDIEYGSEIVAAMVDPQEEEIGLQPTACDARCTVLNLRELPTHVRFGAVDTVDGALVDLTWQAVCHGLGIRTVRIPNLVLGPARADTAFSARYGMEHDRFRRADVDRLEAACAEKPTLPTLASIVMLSWNAPDYTKLAVESIRAHTHSPYEIIIVDNGSGKPTLEMLRALPDVRLICNSSNTGFAHGCNQGLAAARGTHVVLLNNDVVVTDGWLENLLDAHRRDPLVGVSAPRSNRIVGHQQLETASYNSMEDMHRFASERARLYAGVHYRTNRAIGFCLCISRAVIDEVGGIDTRYGIGNFEDDDYCVRVRAAGYQIVVCEDVFIHHFGSVSFSANKVDYSSQMQRNWQIFAARWGLPPAYPSQGYNAAPAIARGFSRARDYVALPGPNDSSHTTVPDIARSYGTAFVAVVDSEAAWSRVGPVVTNYIKSLSVDDSSVFAIGVTGETDAATIGARILRTIDKMKLDERRVADIDVSDVDIRGLDEWLAAIPAESMLRVAKDDRLAALGFATDRSPSGLVRTVRGARR